MRKAGTGEQQRRQAEAEVSRQRQQEVREQVIRPLDRLAEHNQFASIIRASLIEGQGRRR